MEKRYFQIKIAEIETKEDGIVIKGLASTPDIDRYDDIVRPKAFAETMDLYMKNPVVLLQHDSDKPIGRVEDYAIKRNGLYVEVKITENTDGVMEKIQNGTLGAFSIGFIPLDWKITEVGEKMIREITKLDLVEISVVSTPANPHSLFSLAKSIKSFFDSDDSKQTHTLISKKQDMELFKKLLAKLSEGDSVTVDQKELLSIAFDALPEEAQLEHKDAVDKLIIKEDEAKEDENSDESSEGNKANDDDVDEGDDTSEANDSQDDASDEKTDDAKEDDAKEDEKALDPLVVELKAQLEAEQTARAKDNEAHEKKFASLVERIDNMTNRKSVASGGDAQVKTAALSVPVYGEMYRR